jgi:hypothetical protein
MMMIMPGGYFKCYEKCSCGFIIITHQDMFGGLMGTTAVTQERRPESGRRGAGPTIMGRRAFTVLLGGAGYTVLEACGQSIIPPTDAGRSDQRVKDVRPRDMPRDSLEPDTSCTPKETYPESSKCNGPVFSGIVFFGKELSKGSYSVFMTDYGEDNGEKFVVISVSDSCGNEARNLKVYRKYGAAITDKDGVIFNLGDQRLRASAPEIGLDTDGYDRAFAHVFVHKAECKDGGV